MSKRFWCFVLAAFLCFSPEYYVNASGDTPCVVFTGETDKFVFDGDSQNLGESFKGMLPGESRTQKILLENADQRAVEIYFNTNVLKEPDAKGAVYVIRFKVNGEIFAQGKVGGATGKLEDLNDSSISSHSQGEKLYLVALEHGGKAELEMTLEIDGDSMGNDYMNTMGRLEFEFGAQYNEKAGVPGFQGGSGTKTGDEGIPSWVYGLFAASILTIIVLVHKRGTKKGEKKTWMEKV